MTPAWYGHDARARVPYWILALLATATFAAAVTGLAQSPSIDMVAAENTLAAAPFPPVHAPTSFVAVRRLPGPNGTPEVTVDSAATGAVEQVVMPAVVHGMDVGATAVDRGGRIWLTLSHGPRYRCQGPSKCTPLPGSCASAIARIAPQTGTTKFVLIGTANELVEDARPSPNGKLLAYVHATCTAGGRQYLVVRDLTTGRSWTLGKALSPCHAFDGLAWTPSSDALVLDLSGSLGAASGSRTCGTRLSKNMAVVPALHQAPGLPGRQVHLGPNCQAAAATATATGFAAIEACGQKPGWPTGSTGPASLVRFDTALHMTSQTPIGKCTWDSAELRSDPSGSALLGIFDKHCPAPATHPSTPPYSTVLFTDTGRGVRTVFDRRHHGLTEVLSRVSW